MRVGFSKKKRETIYCRTLSFLLNNLFSWFCFFLLKSRILLRTILSNGNLRKYFIRFDDTYLRSLAWNIPKRKFQIFSNFVLIFFYKKMIKFRDAKIFLIPPSPLKSSDRSMPKYRKNELFLLRSIKSNVKCLLSF